MTQKLNDVGTADLNAPQSVCAESMPLRATLAMDGPERYIADSVGKWRRVCDAQQRSAHR
jgi:hypothetical protein